MPLNDTLLSEQLAFKTRRGTRSLRGRSRLPITGMSRSHLHLCHNSPLPYFGRRQRTGICYLDDIRQACLAFTAFSRESALGDPAQQLALLSAAGGGSPAGGSRSGWAEPSTGIQPNSLLYLKCFRNLKNRLSNAIIKLSVNLCNKIHQQRRWVI